MIEFTTAAKKRFRQQPETNYSVGSLTAKQIKAGLQAVSNWSQHEQTICRTFEFEGFSSSIAFVNRITRNAQKLNHHPDIDIRFDKVTLTLTTHEEKGITEKDFSLARQCDEVFFRFFALQPRLITGQTMKA